MSSHAVFCVAVQGSNNNVIHAFLRGRIATCNLRELSVKGHRMVGDTLVLTLLMNNRHERTVSIRNVFPSLRLDALLSFPGSSWEVYITKPSGSGVERATAVDRSRAQHSTLRASLRSLVFHGVYNDEAGARRYDRADDGYASDTDDNDSQLLEELREVDAGMLLPI